MHGRSWRISIAVLALALASFFGHSETAAHAAQGGTRGAPFTHQAFNGVIDQLTSHGESNQGEDTFKNPPSPVCAFGTSLAANVNTDCEGTAPHNETSIAVNPSNPANLLGGANDDQFKLSSGGVVNATLFTRAHVSFDGGKTWAMYPIPYNGYRDTGDPAAAFDAVGTAYMGTLGFGVSEGVSISLTNPDILVAHSTDGGKTWDTVRVASGSGSAKSSGVLNDKDYITAWGDGNVMVTWTRFDAGKGGSYISSAIFDSVSHDGGITWTKPQEISGSAPFCVGAQSNAPTACNQDEFSTPVVAADGSVYVTFENTYNLDPNSLAFGADQYLVVKVDPLTGTRVAGPYLVSHLVDGVYDYPINVNGRQTYQHSEFRTNSAGNITADPTNPSHLAVVWSDMRNSPLPSSPSAYNPDPFSVPTNSDIVVSQSFDGGVTWSAPVALATPDDQFMPWAAYDSSGLLRIGYFDRSYDPANHAYGYTLATEKKPGGLTFTTTQLTTALSDPTQGTRWFSYGVVNHATTTLGDYTGIAPIPTGGVVAFWTDLRNNVCFGVRCGTSEDAFFAALLP